jgi:hypothetical protein
MVGHQAIRMADPAEPIDDVSEDSQEPNSILITTPTNSLSPRVTTDIA